MTHRRRPEAEAAPPRRDRRDGLRAIERWLQQAEDELLYAPDAAEEAAAPSLDARYYLRWGAGSLVVLALLRFPVDARHPVTQTPYGAFAVGEVFPLRYRGQTYAGRVIERQVSRAEGLVELHVQAARGPGGPGDREPP